MSTPRCKNLVLDAGPSPLPLSPAAASQRNTSPCPKVLAELKDKRAREHFERLGLNSGVKIEVVAPDAASLATVIQWAKKTGDYAAAKLADEARNPTSRRRLRLTMVPDAAAPQATVEVVDDPDLDAEEDDDDAEPDLDAEVDGDEQDLEPLDVELQPLDESAPPPTEPVASTSPPSSPEPIFEDPSDDDDGEGRVDHAVKRWTAQGKQKAEEEVLGAGCMTADFAMQNVLLQMGLNLVGVEGKRIQKVKSWVLRCHACFKICKDNSKKFCPSCGNATLLRASVHLKSNFQYRLRGTKYSIPAPKPGSAKKGTGEGLILREDQTEYLRAKKMADGKREREEAKMNKGILGRQGGALGGGKGRTMRASGRDGDLPAIGYGRKNPNERKRRK
ncbi:Nin one binding Zn-ribbon like-domain-containing protein [Mycena vulgaris]|nr:Nin one binding Zn-ribbon like-domain-containing protein [Mycena vulgaris]